MPPKDVVDNFPIASVAVVVGYKSGKDKKEESEVIHTIDGEAVKIISCTHDIQRKVKAHRDPDTKELGDPEPTGEETLILKVKYIRKV
jgi:hypothetical protein